MGDVEMKNAPSMSSLPSMPDENVLDLNVLDKKFKKEGHRSALKMKKIGGINVYYLVLGPYDQLTAEKLRTQLITRGIKVDINRL